jgi:hypothetical protein
MHAVEFAQLMSAYLAACNCTCAKATGSLSSYTAHSPWLLPSSLRCLQAINVSAVFCEGSWWCSSYCNYSWWCRLLHDAGHASLSLKGFLPLQRACVAVMSIHCCSATLQDNPDCALSVSEAQLHPNGCGAIDPMVRQTCQLQHCSTSKQPNHPVGSACEACLACCLPRCPVLVAGLTAAAQVTSLHQGMASHSYEQCRHQSWSRIAEPC